MKKKVIKWLIVLLFSIIICVLSICGYETYLAKHPNPLQHEIEKQKAQQELKEEMDKRFEK